MRFSNVSFRWFISNTRFNTSEIGNEKIKKSERNRAKRNRGIWCYSVAVCQGLLTSQICAHCGVESTAVRSRKSTGVRLCWLRLWSSIPQLAPQTWPVVRFLFHLEHCRRVLGLSVILPATRIILGNRKQYFRQFNPELPEAALEWAPARNLGYAASYC